MFPFIIVTLTSDYEKNLSPVNSFNNDRKRSYFHFHFTSKPKMTKQGWILFLPEKHKLLEKIQNQDAGYDLKKFLLNNINETIINYYRSV